jgi:hypothetical protein
MKPQTAQTSSFLLVTSWAKHQVQHKRPVTKKRILCVIKRFRLHPNLPFLGSRKLPHHLDSACAPYVGCSSEPAFPNRPRSPSKDRHSIEKQDGRNKQNQIIQLSPHDQTMSQQHTEGGNTFRSKIQQESRQRNPCHRSAIFSHSVKYCFLHYGGVRKQVKRKN